MTPWPGFAALLKGAAQFRASWILDVLALESGLDPLVLQRNAKLVPATGDDDYRPEVDGTGLRLERGTGARGLWQKMPTVLECWPADHPAKGAWKRIRLYAPSDPAVQLRDALNFWIAQKATFWGTAELPTREHFYCLNLYPAKVAAPDGVLFRAGSSAYAANKNLDPEGTGVVTIAQLAPAIDHQAALCQPRIRCELEAVRALLPEGFQGPL